MKTYTEFIKIDNKNWESEAIKHLKEKGVIILRGIVDKSTIEIINQKVSIILSKPSFLGGEGFYQKDPYKKTYDGFLIGSEVVESVLDSKPLSIIEKYLDDEIILNEVIIKNDLGYNVKYFPYHKHTGTDVEGDINQPFGCGALIYLNDTDEGAFCYSIGSHLLKPMKRGEPALIEDSLMKEELYNNLHKIVGKKGDYIIFDERGYHGPQQPVKVPRTVILFGFQSTTYTKNRSRTGIPVVISDLKNLSEKQLKIAGIGGGTRSSYDKYHLRKPTTYRPFRVIDPLIKGIIFFNYKLNRLKNKFK